MLTVPSYVYNALVGDPGLLDNLYMSGDLNELVTGGYLTASPSCDNDLLTKIEQSLGPPSIQSLFLMIKTSCNLKCSYCLLDWNEAETLLSPIKTMTMPTATEAVKLFAEQVANNPKPDGYWQAVTFYGGEPMMNLEVLTGVVDLIAGMRVSGTLWEGTEIILNTNGVLIDERFATYAATMGIEVQVSLDGFEQDHDLNRVDHQGNGSFKRAVRGIELLVSAGAKTVPMITVNDQNMLNLTDFVRWMGAELGITEYMMNVLMSETGQATAHYPINAARAMWDAYHQNLEYGICDTTYAGQLESFSPDSPIVRPSCGANGRKLTVFPDGQVHTCQALNNAEVSRVGTLTTFSTTGSQWSNWKRRSRFSRETCLNCALLGSCGAGCAAGAYRASGSINGLDPNHCHWLKETFRLWRSNA